MLKQNRLGNRAGWKCTVYVCEKTKIEISKCEDGFGLVIYYVKDGKIEQAIAEDTYNIIKKLLT